MAKMFPMVIIFWMNHLVCCQFFEANMKSYDIHLTTNNKEGTMLKYVSPKTNAISTLKQPPKVDVDDAKLVMEVITKKNADIVFSHPKLSVDLNSPKYSYKPKKDNPKIYEIHRIFHPPGDVNGHNRNVIGGKRQSGSNVPYEKLDIPVELGVEKIDNTSDQVRDCDEVKETEPCKNMKELSSGDEKFDIDSGDGPKDETLSSNGEQDDESEFPPKVPQIPIELGSSIKDNRLKEKEAKSKQQECQENCSDSYDQSDDENEASEQPQKDIPIELGMTGNSRKTYDSLEKVTYMNHKTPKEFILLETKVHNRKRRFLKKQSPSIQAPVKDTMKRATYRPVFKRSDIADDQELLQTLESFNSRIDEKHNTKTKPIENYVNNLAKDVRNVMSQAKRVLSNTGKVVHSLKSVVNGAAALSSFTKNAANVAKYFEAEPNNATIDYLEERAIVAVLEAQKAASEAREAAHIARSASNKARIAERKMEIASIKDRPTNQQVLHYINLANAEANRAERAAKYAATEKDKTEHDVHFVDKALRRLTIGLSDKQSQEIAEKTDEIIGDSVKLQPSNTSLIAVNDDESNPDDSVETVDMDEDSGIVRDRTPTPSADKSAANKNPYETLNEYAYTKYFTFKQKQLENQLKKNQLLTHDEKASKKSSMFTRRKLRAHYSDKRFRVKPSNTRDTVKVDNFSLPRQQNSHKRQILLENKRKHLIAGEYTGFKKDIVLHNHNTALKNDAAKTLFNTNRKEIIPKLYSESERKVSNAGDDVSKIVKGPITVTVNVRHNTNSKTAPRISDESTKLSDEAPETSDDIFGFKELDQVSKTLHSDGHVKMNDLLDPFKFKEDTNEGSIYDRAHIPRPPTS